MRRTFAKELAGLMEAHPEIHVLTADVGYGMFDEIARRFPDRFWNVGAAEQAMIGMAVGLALGKKVPVCYTITPFLLWRPAELIRNYLQDERVPVILVGSGRNNDYEHDGPTHWCYDDRALLDLWRNIQGFWPVSKDDLQAKLPGIIFGGKPTYINLKR